MTRLTLRRTQKDCPWSQRNSASGCVKAEVSIVISDESKSECFVYITLPRETTSVISGRFVLTKDRRGNSIGQFVYGKSYTSRIDAVEIDPIDLKLGAATHQNARLNGVFSSMF
ncbi:MAG: hypothetical protein K2X93_28595 [Candidatus Obscuribacterales bacterium]|nr:hypothetical protein [Candidatus Obscuribacterales bacterium]